MASVSDLLDVVVAHPFEASVIGLAAFFVLSIFLLVGITQWRCYQAVQRRTWLLIGQLPPPNWFPEAGIKPGHLNKPERHNVLQPREAVIAGIVGLAVMWGLGYAGYLFSDLSPPHRKNWGTLLMVLGFAVPYWLLRWLMKWR